MKLVEFLMDGRVWVGCEQFKTTSPQEIENFYRSLEGEELRLFERVCSNLPCPQEYMREHFREYGWNQEMFEDARMFQAAKLELPVTFFEPPWHCFENSFRYAKKTGLLYVEGIAINPSGIQVHAWNSTDGTDVLDYTWPVQHVNKYFGLIFDIGWMEKNYPAEGGILGHLYDGERKKPSI